MKVWRKNRQQHAKAFIINGKTVIAFLVGDNGHGLLHIETVKGDNKSIFNHGETATPISEIEEKQAAEFKDVEITYEKNGNTTVETHTYKNGKRKQRVYSSI